jgi:predicted aspartyl protease
MTPTHSYPRLVATSIAVLAALVIGPASVHAADESVIPSETCKGLWIVPVSYSDDPDGVLRLLLDTGASYTSVDPDAVERLTGRRVREGKWVRLRDGEAGPMKIRKIKAQVHEMEHTARALGTPLDGILGFPTFENLLLTLDYPAEEIRVSKGSLPEIDDVTVFRDYGKVRPYLALDVGGTKIPVLVDSGFTGGLTLRESDPLEWASEPRAVSTSVRHNGIRIDRAGRLEADLAYGPLTLERPIVEVIEKGTRLSGEDLLRRFAWTFDQRERRIRMIAPSQDPIRLDPVRGTGLGLRPIDAGLEIVHLFADSPAEEAGLRTGDVIVATNGVPVYERGCVSMDDDTKQDSVTLSIVRGGEALDVVVEPRVLVP